MQRVVLDTNVLVSALLFGGPPRRLVRMVAAREIEAATSPPLLAELQGVLQLKFRFPEDIAAAITGAVEAACRVVEPTTSISAIPADPDDNRVLECAVAAKAGAIISGDHHLLMLGAFRGIPILAPQAFLTQQRRPRYAP